MAEVWPVGLPQYVLVQGYSEDAVGDNLVETSPDIGPPISRPRATAAAREMSFNMELSKEQVAILTEFYEVTLAMGSLTFTFPAPSRAGTYLVKFKKDGRPKMSGAGGRYFMVSMSVWILP